MTAADPAAGAAAPRDAATVMVLRDDRGPLEVFCVRRHAASTFLGGAVVFPGGKLELEDQHPSWRQQASAPHPRTQALSGETAAAQALAVCAARETLEEAAIVATEPAQAAAAVERLRAELGGTPEALLVELLAQRQLRLELGNLVPFARWITPAIEARRFDARFFLMSLPSGQHGRHDERETVTSVWATPQRLLESNSAGELFMAPPTVRGLELLAAATTVAAAFELAEHQALDPVRPVVVPGEPLQIALPGDPLHPQQQRLVAGSTRFVLRDGTFVSAEAMDC